jgi:hypothetical protein
MSYATDDAKRSSACEILYACRGKIATDIRQEASRGLPDAQRLADLERVMSQLRNDIVGHGSQPLCLLRKMNITWMKRDLQLGSDRYIYS